MMYLATAERVRLLGDYFVSPERRLIADIRRRIRSHMMRVTRAATSQRHVDSKSVVGADFSDPESQQVLHAIADALIAPLAIQQAREDHARWLARQQVHR
jgi:hypothetical protein